MRDAHLAAVLIVVGAVLAAVGAASTDLSAATALAATGAAVAAFGGFVWVGPTVRHRYPAAPIPAGSTLTLLRDAFRSGPLGRQAIVATVVSLERDAGIVATGMGPDEERRLLALPPAEFRSWLDGRLDRMEHET